MVPTLLVVGLGRTCWSWECLGMFDLGGEGRGVGVSLCCPEREQSWELSCPEPLSPLHLPPKHTLCPSSPEFTQVKTSQMASFERDWLWTNSSLGRAGRPEAPGIPEPGAVAFQGHTQHQGQSEANPWPSTRPDYSAVLLPQRKGLV